MSDPVTVRFSEPAAIRIRKMRFPWLPTWLFLLLSRWFPMTREATEAEVIAFIEEGIDNAKKGTP